MATTAEAERDVFAPNGALSRLPTGAKLFLILSAALLPLAVIAIIATLQNSRVADAETRARLRVAAEESARAIAIELVGDMNALRATTGALATDPADAPSCARAEGVFASRADAGARFVITDRAGRVLCGAPFRPSPPPLDTDQPIAGTIAAGQGLVLSLTHSGGLTARAFFPRDFLARLGAPSTRATVYSQSLMLGQESLALAAIPDATPLDRMETMRVELGVADLSLRTSVRAAPITSSFVVAMLLPLLMWAAAVGIGWFVVDRLLIRPLRQLRTSVSGYQPGEVLETGTRTLPAQEIRELGDTFRAITRTVALHEAGLAEGLVRQTKLTREVHHRVKNNLQVISSLINFHARGAPTPEASAAYASIQRRVDALAVVHRNHFAEMEENRGLGLRSVLGELASNIRATAPDGGIGIVLDVDNYLVNQDVAVAVAFIVTETVELAMSVDPAARIRVSLKPAEAEGRATLRIVSRALVDSDELRDLLKTRYGRVMEGLARQLRAQLHHDPLTGAYEIGIAVTGRD
ncbi:sensor histidine kinase [Sphingomonas lenta]|uniref:histidine kinase n=1 Tax=Sphingomonas lenta TaxID=1141887 RepID=A0A2A2SHG6_9SPHN|nr:sensor histidine kinase [Sphingomonas lenta]PAX08696.1 histidine kinase [Sphingomonas lenta]